VLVVGAGATVATVLAGGLWLQAAETTRTKTERRFITNQDVHATSLFITIVN